VLAKRIAASGIVITCGVFSDNQTKQTENGGHHAE